MHKNELRQHIHLLKKQFSTAELTELSKPIISRLMVHPSIKRAKTVLLYYSLPDEVCTHDAVNLLLEQGKTVLLPVVVSDTDMELRVYTGPADLSEGFFGIKEPIGQLFTDYELIDVAVIPGMGFDSRGNRLGRGKGYYDRLLPRLTNAFKLGMCFAFQRMPGIPTEPTDVVMDEII